VVLHQISTGWLTNLILIIMKNSKAILLAIFASAFAVLTVVNMSLVSPKSAGENTLDMLEIMTRAFDESEGGEGVGGGEPRWNQPTRYTCELSGTVNANGQVWGFGKWINVGGNAGGYFSLKLTNAGTDCEEGGAWLCEYSTCLDVFEAYFAGGGGGAS
jgi:hypothetical protein